MQHRAPIIDDIEDEAFERLKSALKEAFVGIVKLGIGVLCASKIPFARDENERSLLKSMTKAALMQGTKTTVSWALPATLIATVGAEKLMLMTVFACGIAFAGLSAMKATRKLVNVPTTDHEEESTSSARILQEVGYTHTPGLTMPEEPSPSAQPPVTTSVTSKPKIENQGSELQFRMD